MAEAEVIPEIIESLLAGAEATTEVAAPTAAGSAINDGVAKTAATLDNVVKSDDASTLKDLDFSDLASLDWDEASVDSSDLDIDSHYNYKPGGRQRSGYDTDSTWYDSFYQKPKPRTTLGTFTQPDLPYSAKKFKIIDFRAPGDKRGLGYNYTEAPELPSSLTKSKVNISNSMPMPLDGKTKSTPKQGSSHSLAAGIGAGIANAFTGGLFGVINSAITADQQRQTEQARLDRILTAADQAGIPRANVIAPGQGPARQHVLGKGTTIYSPPNFYGGAGHNSTGTYLGFN